MSIYPTVLNNNQASIHFQNIPKGVYKVVLYDIKGARVNEQTILHNGITETQVLPFGQGNLSKGVFEVQVVNADKLWLNQQIVVE